MTDPTQPGRTLIKKSAFTFGETYIPEIQMPFPFINHLITSLHHLVVGFLPSLRADQSASKTPLDSCPQNESQKWIIDTNDPLEPDNYYYAG